MLYFVYLLFIHLIIYKWSKLFVSDILVIREKIYVNVIQSSTELFFLCMVWEKWKASVFLL